MYGHKRCRLPFGNHSTHIGPKLWQTAKRLRDHAMSPTKRYWHEEIGYNYRMTNLQAALGVAQLKRIDTFTAERREVMSWYRADLAHRNGIRLNREAPWAKSAFWMVCLEVDGMTDATRADFMAGLRQRGVDSRPYFYPMSDMPMYPNAVTPVAHRAAHSGINLPSYVGLTRADVKHICRTVEHSLDESGLQ